MYSRMIVGWTADTTMHANLVTDTLEMAVWSRGSGQSRQGEGSQIDGSGTDSQLVADHVLNAVTP